MKKSVKWLSLLLTGLLLSVALIACDSKKDPEIDTEDDKTQADDDQPPTEPSPYHDLTPEALLNALLKAKNFTITEEKIFVSGDTQSGSKHILTKNGNKLSNLSQGQFYATNESPTDASNEIQTGEYIDLENDLIYFQTEIGGKWIVQSYKADLGEILHRQSREGLLYDNASYGEYDAENNRYPMKTEALMDALLADSGTAVEGYMTRKGSTYTFYLSEDHGAYSSQSTITVEFTADEIQFPEGEISVTEADGNTALPGKEQ